MSEVATAKASRARRVLLTCFLWASPLLIAVALGKYAKPPEPVPGARVLLPPAGAAVARQPLPPPPPDLSETLYALGVGAVSWYAVLFAFPLLLLGARKLQAGRGRWILNTVCVGGTLLLGIGLTVLVDYFVQMGDRPPAARPPFGMFVMRVLRNDVLPWIALFGAVGAIEWRRRAVHAEIERERLRAEASEQRLLALMAQVRPHFLFNTLQAISTLLHRDPRAADEMLGRLSELLRSVLEHRDRAFVPLAEEMRLTIAYLEIAKARFGDRLSFGVDLPPEMRSLEVPLFILQPLVENALTHGIGKRLSGGRVTVRATRAGERLRIEVEDDGPGLGYDATPEGIGLSNTRERLSESFGKEQAFGLEPGNGGVGAVAYLEVPWRTCRNSDERQARDERQVNEPVGLGAGRS